MYSMTGFGKASQLFPECEINIEIKSVNHRFADIQCRLPYQYAQFEILIREKIKQKIKRGRIECSVGIKTVDQSEQRIEIHWEKLETFVNEMQTGWEQRFKESISKQQIFESAMQQSELFLEVVDAQKVEVDEHKLLSVLESALMNLQESRQREGEALKSALVSLAAEIPKELAVITENREQFRMEIFTKLQAKLSDLLESTAIQEERILTETAILVDRSDIQEEIDRMQIHVQQLYRLLEIEGPVGRELDFLIQEMNREVNTIGSKSAVIEIKNAVVALKAVLEKIREQIQNIE